MPRMEDEAKPKFSRLLDVNQVADRYQIHPKTVLRFYKEGRLPKPIKTPFTRSTQWVEEDIEKHIAELDRQA